MKCIIFSDTEGKTEAEPVALVVGNDTAIDAAVVAINAGLTAQGTNYGDTTELPLESGTAMRVKAVRCDSTVDSGDTIVEAGLWVEVV